MRHEPARNQITKPFRASAPAGGIVAVTGAEGFQNGYVIAAEFHMRPALPLIKLQFKPTEVQWHLEGVAADCHPQQLQVAYGLVVQGRELGLSRVQEKMLDMTIFHCSFVYESVG